MFLASGELSQVAPSRLAWIPFRSLGPDLVEPRTNAAVPAQDLEPWDPAGEREQRSVTKALHRALDLGVNYVDTAPGYGNGISEEVLGRALWKGKVFYRDARVLRNRIDDLAVLEPIVGDPGDLKKLTFEGATTWQSWPRAA